MTTLVESPQRTREPKPVISDRARAETRLGQRLVAPAIALMLVVTAFPMLRALYLSLFNYALTAPEDREFVGLSNRIATEVSGGHATLLGSRVGVLAGSVEQGPGHALVRPESVRITPVDAGGESNATVVDVGFLGPFSRVHCRLSGGQLVVAQISSAQASSLAQDAPVRVDVDADAVLVVPD